MGPPTGGSASNGRIGKPPRGQANDVASALGATSRRHLGDALMAGLAWRIGAPIVTRNARDLGA